MKTKIVKIIALILLLLLPVVSLPVVAFSLPDMYGETFVGALDEKFDRLTNTEGKKLILVGGSSVAFGIDSALLEEYLGMPVVNFGLYADLGTKVMMDLSRAGIGEGDIVILMPETAKQTMSLYFNSDTTLKATDGRHTMLRYLRGDNILSVAGAMWNFTAGKVSLSLSGETVHGSGIYDARYFNPYGDIDGTFDLNGDGEPDYPRLANAMAKYYDPTTPIRLSADTLSADFVDYVNEYKKFCEKRGAKFYFGFCPMNRMAVEDASDDTVSAYEKFLRNAFGKDTVLGSAADHIFDAGYFYDTNFHPNSAGVIAHTVTLLKELLLAEEITDVQVTTEIPEAPPLPENDVTYEGEDDENARYFTFEFVTERDPATGLDRELGYRITGLSEVGKTMTELTIPVNYRGYRVTMLGASALAGGRVKTLILPSSFRQFAVDDVVQVFAFEDGCFADSGVRDLWIYIERAANIPPPASFAGMASDYVIHVADRTFTVDYNWSQAHITDDHFAFDAK